MLDDTAKPTGCFSGCSMSHLTLAQYCTSPDAMPYTGSVPHIAYWDRQPVVLDHEVRRKDIPLTDLRRTPRRIPATRSVSASKNSDFAP
eukprot:3179231-Rhodomonas_salina.3